MRLGLPEEMMLGAGDTAELQCQVGRGDRIGMISYWLLDLLVEILMLSDSLIPKNGALTFPIDTFS